jgi:diguanylate cyclase (GGDEF)-like protein
MKTFLGVPLRIRGKNLGNLYLTEKANGQVFTVEDEALLVMIARDAAMALENARLYEETRRLANMDSLTGLYNRRYFEEWLKEELARAQRYNHPISLVILDMDHLKQINDGHGHVAGDQAIKAVGEVLARNIRATDVAARLGGDEFVVLLPETDRAGARQMAQRLKRQCTARSFKLEAGTSLCLTVSIGTATYPQDAMDIEGLMKAADQVLYHNKTSHSRESKN